MVYRILIYLGLLIFLTNCAGSKSIISKNGPIINQEKMHKKAYTIFDKNGNISNYASLLESSLASEIVLFGELHNNPICHWLQSEITSDVASKSPITLGLEMIEKDNQDMLNQYLLGNIDAEGLDSSARLWNNYNTDYKPIIDYAKDNNIKVAASNIPRRYASMVFKNGFEILDTLPEDEKAWIAPLPIEYDATLPAYIKMLEMMGDHAGDNFPKAQAIKDATMAHSILTHLEKDKIFLHFHGTFHSDHYEGILWYLQRTKPAAKYLTISSVEQESIGKLETEHLNKADYIICIPETMTKTY